MLENQQSHLLKTDNALALNEAQKGIWLGQKLQTESPLYNAAEAIEIKGPLNIKLFERALNKIILDTSSLNIKFHETENSVIQYIDTSEDNCCILLQKDFSENKNPREEAFAWMKSLISIPINLETEKPYKQALIKLSENHFIWYQQIHHIACDGYAFSLISQKLNEEYNKLIKSNKEIHEDEIKYADFTKYTKVITEDEQYHESEFNKKDREFWLENLQNNAVPESLSDSNEPISGFAIRKTGLLTTQQREDIQAISANMGTDWSAFLLAIVSYLIYRRRASSEVTIGLPIMGRMGSASLRIPSMVMNIIPLKINLSNADNFNELIHSVSQQIKAIRPHQRYRYEHLKRDLNLIGGSKKLFGPVVNIMPFDRKVDFYDLHCKIHNISAGPVEDISFNFILNKEGSLQFNLDANPNRYNEQEIAILHTQTCELIKELICDPNQKLEIDPQYLSCLDASPIKEPIAPTLQLIYEKAQNNAEHIAVIDREKQLTYSELLQKSLFIANAIKQFSLPDDRIIALCLPRGHRAIIANIASMISKHTYLFIDPDGPEKRNKLIIDDANPGLIIYQEKIPDEYRINTRCINYEALENSIEGNTQKTQKEIIENNLSQLAYIIYTSGSTGKPKGVMINQKSLSEFVIASTQAYDIKHSDKILQFAPLHFDASVEEIFLALCNGATLVIRDENMLESTANFINACEQNNITLLDLPTAYWHELVFYCKNTKTPLPKSVHTVIIGGEAALQERLDQWHQINHFNTRLLNTYGPSEATVVASFSDLTKSKPLSIGKPLPGRKIAIIDQDGKTLLRGHPGELILLGAGLGSGYLNLPEESNKKFSLYKPPFSNTLENSYHTGDMARINSQGEIEYLGRLDDEIKISGHRINPVEVESEILSIDHIKEVAVVLQQADQEKHLIAYIVTNTKIDIQWLREYLSKRLPLAMLPSSVHIIQELPKNQSGKIDRQCLRKIKPLVSHSSLQEDTLSHEEMFIIKTWKNILGQNEISVNDDFFLLGGQSLQTIQVANRLSAHFNRDIPVSLIFQYPVVSQLARKITTESNQAELNQDDSLQEAIITDSQFEESWLNISTPEKTETNTPKNILITGATGFVGIQLLYKLLRHTKAKITCLIRGKNIEQAEFRLKDAMHSQGINYYDYSQRIQVYIADLEKEDLNIDQKTLEKLNQDIDTIWHNAANTSVMRSYQSLKAVNLQSTKFLLKIFSHKKIPFNFVSTISVIPTEKNTSSLSENFLDWHNNLSDGYQQSKWASENILKQASTAGVPIRIYRLARVSGHTETGLINHKDLIWKIIFSSIRHQSYPDIDIKEPWTPVNIIADAMVKLSISNSADSVLNVIPKEQVRLLQLFEWINQFGYKLNKINLKEWLDRLETSPEAEDNTLFSFFNENKNNEKPLSIENISNSKFTLAIEKTDATLPALSQEIFYRYLHYAIQKNLIAPPESVKKELSCENT